MRLVLQRVSSANVTIGGRVTGRIDRGLLLLLGVAATDTAADGEWLARKVTGLRIFPDEAGQMNRSVADIGGGILLISQFTLLATTHKGNRPSFNLAARPETARPLYEQFIAQLTQELGRPPATGEFGADMQVALVNDGPVTLTLESPQAS